MEELIAALTPEEMSTVAAGFSILAEATKRIEAPAKNNR
jgi:hypothetical protein